MSEKTKCINFLSESYPQQAVLQEFNSHEDGDATTYKILECFDELEYKDVIGLGYAIDYLLFYLVQSPDKYKVGTLLTELTTGPKKVQSYLNPLITLASSI